MFVCASSLLFILWAGSLQALPLVPRCVRHAGLLCNMCPATGDKTNY